LHWSFHTTSTDAPVATIHDIPWGDVRDELLLVVGQLGRFSSKRIISPRS